MKIKNLNNKIVGIYMIYCKTNGKKYIGSSKNIKNRLYKHRSHLRRNTHCNPHLQNAFNKYKENSFKIEIIKICKLEELLMWEQYCIDELKPEFNIQKQVFEVEIEESTKVKISSKLKELYKDGLPRQNTKSINCYLKDGAFVKQYQVVADAVRELKISYSTIKNSYLGRIDIKGKYYFRYSDDPCQENKVFKKEYTTLCNSRSKPVICLTDGKIFLSYRHAAYYYGIQSGSIIQQTIGRNYTIKGLNFELLPV